MRATVILLESFPATELALVRATVDAVNTAAGQPLVELATASLGGAPVAAADGTTVIAEVAVSALADDTTLVLLLGGPRPAGYLPMALRGALRAAALRGAALAAGGEAVHVLSALGYLDGHRATLPPLPEPTGPMPPPRPIVNDPGRFAHDGPRLTTRGGLAIVDMLLSWIAASAGLPIAEAAARALHASWTPDIGPAARTDTGEDPTILRMKAVMRANLAAPLALEGVAETLGLSPKQLRARCHKCLGTTPARAYLDLRLQHAFDLVAATAMTVADIAAASGFDSPSSFTRSFRDRFGLTPRDLRADFAGAPDRGTWENATAPEAGAA